MFYTIYKVTNKINGKIYIGKHQTKDLNDGYMGSGKHLKRAIEKYGLNNFAKEILFVFDNEVDMNVKESELVTEEFVKKDTNYNLCPGGNGGFGYINSNNLSGIFYYNGTNEHKKTSKLGQHKSRIIMNKLLKENGDWAHNYKDKISKAKKRHTHGNGRKGTRLPDQTKEKISKSNLGSKNSQYGTVWITNGLKNKKIDKQESIPEGWYRGRSTFPKHSEQCP